MSKESLLHGTQQKQVGIAALLDSAMTWVGALFFFLFPLAYLTVTTEFTEYTKLNLALLTALLLVLLWGLRVLASRKVSVLKTPFNAAFVLIILALVLTTIFSVSPFTSLYGQFNVWHFTLPEVLAFMIIFFALASVNNPIGAVRRYLSGLLFSTSIVSVLVIFNYLNVFDRFFGDGSQLNMLSVFAIDGFSPAGNTLSTWFVLGMSIILLGTLLRVIFKNGATIAAILPMVGSLNATKAVIGAVLALHVLALIFTLGAYIPGMPARFTPINQVNLADSWRVASTTIRDRVWFGTGPSTYNTAYNAYRPARINQTDDWATAYHRAGSEYFTWLTTTGMVGFAAFVFFIGRLIVSGMKAIRQSDPTGQASLPYEGNGLTQLRLPLALIALLIVVAFFVTSSTVTILGVLFMVLVMWMLIERLDTHNGSAAMVDITFGDIVDNINVGKKGEMTSVPALPLVTGLLFLLISGLGSWYVVQDIKSNLAYADSVRLIAENSQALDIYNAQRRAIALNPRRDAYRRAYANTNISTARVVAAERGESITDTQRQEVIQLIQQSLREVRIATELLNPYSALNWQTRGRIYQSLLGVANGADNWALQAYQQAVILSPQDPQLRVDLGGLYFALATTTIADDGTVGEEPGENVPTVPDTRQANLLRAISVFQDAARLKPDFVAAHFNLALAYKEADRNDLALQEFETTLSLLDEGTEDYNRVSEEIDSLRDAGVTPPPTPAPTPTQEGNEQATPTVTEAPTPVPTVTPTAAATATPTPAQ